MSANPLRLLPSSIFEQVGSKQPLDPQQRARPLILITDMGGATQDPGDILTVYMLRGLERMGYIELRAIIVHAESRTIGDVASQLVTNLGFANCAVATFSWSSPNFSATAMRSVFESVLDASEAKSVLLVNVCPLSALSHLLDAFAGKCAHKLLGCTIFGGWRDLDLARWAPQNLRRRKSEADFFLQPDPSHSLFLEDLLAAERTFRHLQELHVPMTVVSRHVAYQGSSSRDLFDTLARFGVPGLTSLRDRQREGLERLFIKAQAPLGSVERGSLPGRCNLAWFAQTMCDGVMPTSTEDVWELASSVPLYDCVTTLAAVPETAERLFRLDSARHDSGPVVHTLLGESAWQNGVLSSYDLQNAASEAIVSGAMLSMQPFPMLVFMDPGQDLDDELSLIMIRTLVAEDHIRLIGVVANLAPALQRARLAKGTLQALGLPDVPVAVGTDGGCPGMFTDHFSASAQAYLAKESEVETDWIAMAGRVMEAEADGSVLIVCLSSMTDARQLLSSRTQLCQSKVHSFTVMGGVMPPSTTGWTASSGENPTDLLPPFPGAPSATLLAPSGGLAASGYSHQPRSSKRPSMSRSAFGDVIGTLQPDSANNNTFDIDAARDFYEKCQQLGFRLNVITRIAAYDAPIARTVWDALAKTGHPVARRLISVQREGIEELWARANAKGEARRGLPARCDARWFKEVFLDPTAAPRKATEPIWDAVTQFNAYDPLAVLAAVPHLAWRFFEHDCPMPAFLVKAEPVRIIGYTPERSGIKERAELARFMSSILNQALVDSLKHASANGSKNNGGDAKHSAGVSC